ncbi:MAG: fibronectin type III domain-containing protein [Syntrophobacteraceae bacterium]|nr:fibronectin type III domain-containing protein [Syntrophobacteraceae bacterium]
MKLKLLVASILLLCTALPSQAASVRLAWNRSPGRSVAGYRVHYGLKPGKYSHVLQVKGRRATQVVIKDLKEGKTYFFAVTAYNKKGEESALSPEISGKPDGKTPKNQNRTAPVTLPQSHEPSPAKIPPKTLPTGPDGKIPPSRQTDKAATKLGPR